MEHLDFDNLSNSTLTPASAEAANFAESAMQYLYELNEVEKKLKECLKRLKEKSRQLNLQSIVIEKVKHELKLKTATINEKNRIIASLNAIRPNTPNDLGKIQITVAALSKRIYHELESFRQTGSYPTLEDTINEVRGTFNIALQHLNKFNVENKKVDVILQLLTTLDNCEQKLRNARHQMRT